VLVWGAQDKLFPTVYGRRYQELLTATDARLDIVEAAAHMLPYEQPAAAAASITSLLG
jgi:pimeloyl-ACP methyl ester carboxylesterase